MTSVKIKKSETFFILLGLLFAEEYSLKSKKAFEA